MEAVQRIKNIKCINVRQYNIGKNEIHIFSIANCRNRTNAYKINVSNLTVLQDKKVASSH